MCVRDLGKINSSLNLRFGGDNFSGQSLQRQDSQTLRKSELEIKKKQFCTFLSFVLVLDAKKKNGIHSH